MFGHSFTFGWSALALCFASGSASAALVTHQPCSPKPQQFLESTQLGRHVGDFEYPWNGTFFSGVFTDGAVLQQSPAAAAVYGIVAGPTSADTKVSVQVTDQTTRESYAVVATAKQLLPVKKSTRSVGDGQLFTWKAMLQPHANGGNVSISATCTGCANTTAATISDVTFGDVWVCSGQSNAWLPMEYTVTRNRTYHALDVEGRYKNIRIVYRPTTALPDGQEAWIVPPAPPSPVPPSTRFPPQQWTQPNSTLLGQFSAMCWYFAQELTDAAIAAGETPPNFGLVASYWGGTEIETWQPNSSITNCVNSTGGAIINRAQGNGALFNGMIAPFVNTTIKGALWYQGENNVYECADGYGVAACGSPTNGSGYACQLANMITQWRQMWSEDAPQGTDPSFPFGIMQLADGTSEGHGTNMANFRFAQTMGLGVLPPRAATAKAVLSTAKNTNNNNNNKIDTSTLLAAALPNTFMACGHDAGDPADPGDWRDGAPASKYWAADTPYQAIYDGRPMYDNGGVGQLSTNWFMGPIHPRVKQTAGRRLATAARALVYGDKSIVHTGPVLSGCNISNDRHGQEMQISFDQSLMGTDGVHVWNAPSKNEAFLIAALMACLNATDLSWRNDGACAAASAARWPTPASPLEVELNGTVWVPVALQPAKPNPAQATNNVVTVQLPEVISPDTGKPIALEYTGVRYAWSEAPCCPNQDRSIVPCPTNSCPIQTYNTTLPAPPFNAMIVGGKCKCYAPQVCDD